MKRIPDSGSLWFSQGLHLIQLGQTDEALVSLKRAAELEDEGSRHRYVYAIALNDTGSGPEAMSVLEGLNAKTPASLMYSMRSSRLHGTAAIDNDMNAIEHNWLP